MLRRVAPLLCLPLLFVTSCEEEVNTLFDEEGVWALVELDLDAAGLTEVSDTRENGFMLWFHPQKKGEGVVAAASCVDQEGKSSPESSLCHLDENSTWGCQCFKYEFEESSMRWLEYEPGSAPPADVPNSTGGDTDGTDGPTFIQVAKVDGKGFTYIFQPLPTGVFGAKPESTFVFQQKATTTWTSAQMPPMAPPDCEMQCL